MLCSHSVPSCLQNTLKFSEIVKNENTLGVVALSSNCHLTQTSRQQRMHQRIQLLKGIHIYYDIIKKPVEIKLINRNNSQSLAHIMR